MIGGIMAPTIGSRASMLGGSYGSGRESSAIKRSFWATPVRVTLRPTRLIVNSPQIGAFLGAYQHGLVTEREP
jgi:hypothetical protein